MQSLDLGKGIEQNFSLKMVQSATNKKVEKEPQSAGGFKTTLKQPNKKATNKEENEHRKAQSTASTLHSSRNTAAGQSGTDDLFSLVKSPTTNTDKSKSRVSESNKYNFSVYH